MIGDRLRWGLPVVYDPGKEADTIHPKAKFHYFPKSENDYSQSLCGNHFLIVEKFEVYPNLIQWEELSEAYYCKKCLRKLKKQKERGIAGSLDGKE